jgi:hypothetical protein
MAYNKYVVNVAENVLPILESIGLDCLSNPNIRVSPGIGES